jgi:protein-disulfide isomerase-like protein with CxxC motif
MANGTPTLQLVEYTDPYCTWCWGSEPTLRRIEEVYGEQVSISFIMGGLVENISRFYDPLNRIGGEDWWRQVATHWREASARHGMPVDERIFEEIKDEFRSTYPASIAYKAAEIVDRQKAPRYLRLLREGAAARRMPIHRLEIQSRLAEVCGIDVGAWRGAMESGEAKRAFEADLRLTRSKGITGFPTFEIRHPSGRLVILRGYRPFEFFRRAFEDLAPGELVEREVKASEEAILRFIRKHGSVAPREVGEVFGLSDPEARDLLHALQETGQIRSEPAGTGSLWSPVER